MANRLLIKIIISVGFTLCLLSCAPNAPLSLQEIDQFIDNGQLSSAEKIIKEQLLDSPDDQALRYRIGRIYLLNGNYAGADKELTLVDTSNPLHEKAQVLLLMSYIMSLDIEGGVFFVKNLTEEASEGELSPELQSLIAINYLVSGEIASFDQYVDSLSDNAPYKAVLVQVKSKILDGIIEKLDESDNSSLEWDLLSLFLKGRFYSGLNKPQEAAETFFELYRKTTGNPLSLLFAADSSLKAQDEELSKQTIGLITEYFPQSVWGQHLASIYWFGEQDYEQSLGYAESANNSGMNNISNSIVLGVSHFQLGAYESALTNLERVEDRLPPSHPAIKVLTTTRIELGLVSDAVESLNKVEANSESSNYIAASSFSILNTGNESAINSLLSSFDARKQENTFLNNISASLKLELDRKEEAIGDLKRGNETFGDLKTKKLLIHGLIANNELQQAAAYLNEWLAESPDVVEYWVLSAFMHEKNDKLEEAASALEQALSLDNENTLVKVGLIKVYGKLGESERIYTLSSSILEEMPLNKLAWSAVVSSFSEKSAITYEQFKTLLGYIDSAPINQNQKALISADVMLQANLIDEADQALETVDLAELSTENLGVYYKDKSLISLRRGDTAQGIENLKAWIENAQSEEAIINTIIALEQNEELGQAASILEVFNERSATPQTQLLEAYYMYKSDKLSEAHNKLNRISEPSNNSIGFHTLNSRVSMKLGKFTDAANSLTYLYGQAPSIEKSRDVIAANLAANSERENISFIERHLQTFEDDLSARNVLAEIYFSRDRSKAISQYEYIIEKTPDNPLVLNNLAWLYFENNELDKAHNYITKATGIVADNDSINDTLQKINAAIEDAQ